MIENGHLGFLGSVDAALQERIPTIFRHEQRQYNTLSGGTYAAVEAGQLLQVEQMA